MSDDDAPKWERLDQFWTPAWPVRLLLGNVDWVTNVDVVADPFCGRGDILEVVHEYAAGVTASDIDETLREHHRSKPWEFFDHDARFETAEFVHSEATCVVTNPPYHAETGSAGSTLEKVVRWVLPTAALLPLHFLEMCGDRAWAWSDENLATRPSRVLMLPRVEFEYPGDSPGNRENSMWVIWHPDDDGPVTIEHFSESECEFYRGQEPLL